MRDFRLLHILMATLMATNAACVQMPNSVEFLNSGAVIPTTLPFSEAVRVGNIVYLSGQIGINPGTMELVPGGISTESVQAMRNIKLSLEANGFEMKDLIKCTVMLADMSEWSAFNEIYASFFEGQFPARSAFGTQGLALNARVEVECIAVADNR